MIPPTPMPFAAFGPLWYGELFCGLCRALAAPWLDPWWLAKGMQTERPEPSRRAATTTLPQESPTTIGEAPVVGSASHATIIPFDLARVRAAAKRAAANQEQRGPSAG